MSTFSTRDVAGFSLLEVVIALLVLALGLLGWAAFQIRLAQQTTEIYYLTHARQLATELAERIHIYQQLAGHNDIAPYMGRTGYQLTPAASCQGTLFNCACLAATTDVDCYQHACTPHQLVISDQHELACAAAAVADDMQIAVLGESAHAMIEVSWPAVIGPANEACSAASMPSRHCRIVPVGGQ